MENIENQRTGVLVKPYERLSQNQIEAIHKASLNILEDPGIISYNKEAVDIFKENGAEVTQVEKDSDRYWNVKIPKELVEETIKYAPKKVVLGARDKKNRLILDAEEPRVRFGSGSEANVILDVNVGSFVNEKNPDEKILHPILSRRPGTVEDLCKAAHLAEHLENLDFFIRTVNIQDDDITDDNKDVNKFYASLNNMTKHVMAGLTELKQLNNVLKMAEIIAGGKEELRKNPIISFITCITKSPLQFVEDTTQKMIEIVKQDMPVVISCNPQGGTTAPIQEAGIVTQLNAEILSGITLAQLVKKGAPVLYGSVPIRSRMDNLHDSYGSPEFSKYNVDGIQMARFYKIPCYSTVGVADIHYPGIQATVEKLFSHIYVAMGGPHYAHYAFGLLERTNTFCMAQAVLDDTHLGLVKYLLKKPDVEDSDINNSIDIIRKVMDSPNKLYVRYARQTVHKGEIAAPYKFESSNEQDNVLIQAHEKLQELLSKPVEHIPPEINEQISREISGILPRLISKSNSS